ncbi:hypothetical protein ACFSJW_01790 [Flavobacterium artemisiae]|uniref:Uncharacterized protein n=1 Tax=Flavobacterium artemisiae TaxID=2126556 RepID=A0ABW4HIX1_9FLAO
MKSGIILLGIFYKCIQKKTYAQEWDQLLLDINVVREPSIYAPFGNMVNRI